MPFLYLENKFSIIIDLPSESELLTIYSTFNDISLDFVNLIRVLEPTKKKKESTTATKWTLEVCEFFSPI